MSFDRDKVNNYFKSKRVSNSLLKALSNPRWVKIKMDNPDQEDEDKRHFRLGSALDCILTDPDRFDDNFFVIDVVRPTGYMGKFIQNLPAGLAPQSPEELYQEAYDKAGYKQKLSTVINTFWTKAECVEYYNCTRNSNSREIISKDEYDIVLECKNKILSNKFVEKYFVNKYPHIELCHQLPIYFEYKELECKSLLDGVRIDHLNKTIEPFDLKSIGRNVYEFPFSCLSYGYYCQAAFYIIALKEYIKNERKDLLEYTFLPFAFIVVESKLTSSYAALIFETCDRDIEVGLNGGYRGSKYYKGINELIEAYKYHMTSGQWNLPKDVYEANGRILLNLFNNDSKPDDQFLELPDTLDRFITHDFI